MKKLSPILLACGILFTGVSCNTYAPNTKAGAAIGGLTGAGLGGIIGHQSGRGLEGAAIGAGAGIIAGGLLGAAADDRNAANNQPPPPPPPPRRYYGRDPYYGY
ncbi:MAG: hypothetical protein KA004_06650 [Verrucomicrobiales bacterium]|nr:hypothetical protein [Verrucomicrobiales bacterium]